MQIPPALIVFFIGLFPIIDRTAIPLGIAHYGMDIIPTTLVFLLGNYVGSILVFNGLRASDEWFRKRIKPLDRFLTWLFARTRAKHDKRINELGHLALFLFVCVPLPGSGNWSAALVAYVFGLKPKVALPIIGSGLAVAALLIALATEGVINLSH